MSELRQNVRVNTGNSAKSSPVNLKCASLRPAGFAVFADFFFRFSSMGRDFLGLIWTRLGESYTVRYPAGAQGKGESPRSPAKVENGHSGKMLQLEGVSRLFGP